MGVLCSWEQCRIIRGQRYCGLRWGVHFGIAQWGRVVQVKMCIFHSVQSPLLTYCVYRNSTGLKITSLWIKMGSSLWPSSGGGG